MVPKFNTGELNVVARVSGFMPGTSIPVYDFPIPPKEAYLSIYQKKPIWQITDYESRLFSPSINPDNIARAFAYDGNFIPGVSNQTGGKDMF
ncbi:MAG: methyltransferase, partial [Oscillospiraceae bacterium]